MATRSLTPVRTTDKLSVSEMGGERRLLTLDRCAVELADLTMVLESLDTAGEDPPREQLLDLKKCLEAMKRAHQVRHKGGMGEVDLQ